MPRHAAAFTFPHFLAHFGFFFLGKTLPFLGVGQKMSVLGTMKSKKEAKNTPKSDSTALSLPTACRGHSQAAACAAASLDGRKP